MSYPADDNTLGGLQAVEAVFERIAQQMRSYGEASGPDFVTEIFRKFDLDGNGTVSHDEFQKVSAGGGRSVSLSRRSARREGEGERL
jgi:hypothetical protein